jgi:hypothetical protein
MWTLYWMKLQSYCKELICECSGLLARTQATKANGSITQNAMRKHAARVSEIIYKCQVASVTTAGRGKQESRKRRLLPAIDITDGLKTGSNQFGDSVSCMSRCTHPHCRTCEIVSVYTGESAMASVKCASLLGISEVS